MISRHLSFVELRKSVSFSLKLPEKFLQNFSVTIILNICCFGGVYVIPPLQMVSRPVSKHRQIKTNYSRKSCHLSLSVVLIPVTCFQSSNTCEHLRKSRREKQLSPLFRISNTVPILSISCQYYILPLQRPSLFY